VIPIEELIALDSSGGVFRAILVDGGLAGFVSLVPTHEVMVAVLPEYRCKGVASEALNKLARIAFDELGIKRITAKVKLDRPSTLLARKIGAVEIARTESEAFYEYTADTWRNKGVHGA